MFEDHTELLYGRTRMLPHNCVFLLPKKKLIQWAKLIASG